MQSYKKNIIALFLLVFVLGFLTKERHSNNGDFNWRAELWADQVGYYVYLPSLFIYGFDANQMDPQITDKTGHGFEVDREHNKVLTKYTCGVAIMQLPFFLLVHSYQKNFREHANGFEGMYHNIPNLGASFYGALGLFFLFIFLRKYFSTNISIATVAAIFLGTNLYYYTIDHTGMSHVYSFFLFSVTLNLVWQIVYDETKRSPLYIFLLSVCAALIVLIRPTNLLFVVAAVLIDCNSWQNIKERIAVFFQPKFILIALSTAFFVFLPQFLYWQYSSGNLVHYSYNEEGFIHLKDPKLIELWFAPHNGLFPYSPLFLVLVLAALVMIIKKIANGVSILAVFFLLSYICASWHIYSFGCGFGSRNFVEYTSLFALPLAHTFNWANKNSLLKTFTILVVAFCIFISQKLTFTYDKCFFGTGDWDWSEYSRLIKRGYHHESFNVESPKTNEEFIGTTLIHPSATMTWANYERIWLSAVLSTSDIHKETSLVIETLSNDIVLEWQKFEIRHRIFENNKKGHVIMDFAIKKDVPNKDLVLKAYLWNPHKADLDIDKFEIFIK